MDYILRLENLTKMYGKQTVVDHVNFTVEAGHICGLIGPNGAGKTTIMKMIAGIAEPTGGSIGLFGSKENLNSNRSRASFMLEAPILEPSMNARQNMEYIRYVRGVEDQNRISEILEFVGLSHVGKKKAGQFSLGMRQRLGIAMALLPSPELMILDEPVNGLDPEGIVEIRNIIKKLSSEKGITILISSHLLSELSEICSDYVIVREGKVVESLSAEDLEKKCSNYIAIRTDNILQTATVLEQALHTKNYKIVEDEIYLYDHMDCVEQVSREITGHNLTITKFLVQTESLEKYYMSKVGSFYE